MIQAAPLSDYNGNGGVALLGEQIFCSSDRLRREFASLHWGWSSSLKNNIWLSTSWSFFRSSIDFSYCGWNLMDLLFLPLWKIHRYAAVKNFNRDFNFMDKNINTLGASRCKWRRQTTTLTRNDSGSPFDQSQWQWRCCVSRRINLLIFRSAERGGHLPLLRLV